MISPRPDLPPPPAGFAPMTPPALFIRRAATFFARGEADSSVTVGTWITADHSNSTDVAHGGFLLTFADFALSYILTGITLSLSADFLRPARVGDWLEARIAARRRSAGLIFADAIATCGGKDVLRVSGVFRPYEERA